MSKRIEAINAQLNAIGLELEARKGFRTKEGRSRKRFAVYSTSGEHYMGSDGESNFRNFFSTIFYLDSVKELTLDRVKAEMVACGGKTLEQIAADVASKAAAEEARIAESRRQYAAKREAEEAALKDAMQPATESELQARRIQLVQRIGAADQTKLAWHARDCYRKQMIVADHYREDFLRLIHDERVQQMARELLSTKQPEVFFRSEYDSVVGVMREANKRGIVGGSIGSVHDVLRYLVLG